MNLLFIDDDEIIRDSYRNFLKIYFNKVYESSNSLNALDIYEKKEIDMILVDIGMKGMNGITFVQTIRRNDPDILILMLTGHDEKEYLLEAVRLNLFDYLIKPVDRLKFSSSIKNAVINLKHNKKTNEYIELINNYSWNSKLKKLYKNNEIMDITKRERMIFITFCNKENIIFSNEEVSNLLYEYEEFNENKVRMVLKRLKGKYNLLKCHYGIGNSFILR